MCEHEDLTFASFFLFFMLLTDDSLLVLLKKMMGIQDPGNNTI